MSEGLSNSMQFQLNFKMVRLVPVRVASIQFWIIGWNINVFLYVVNTSFMKKLNELCINKYLFKHIFILHLHVTKKNGFV